MKTRTLALFLSLALGSPAARAQVGAQSDQAPAAQAPAPQRFGRIASDAAVVRNIYDKAGNEIARPKKGTLVAVWSEQPAGWLEVEVPGGFAVWVHGRMLAPTAEASVYEVTKNAVNMRPAPRSDETSFPLPRRLMAGDRVRVLEWQDPAADPSTTWARILSPAGVGAWLESSAVVPLQAGEDGAASWKAAHAALRPQPAPAAPPAAAGAGSGAPAGGASETAGPGAPSAGPADGRPLARPSAADEAQRTLAERETRARAALEEARDLYAREATRSEPDYEVVRAAYARAIGESKGGEVALLAQGELDRLAVLERASALKAELRQEKDRRTREFLERQRALLEAARIRDPLSAAFLSYGVLERRVGVDGTPRFCLKLGGEAQSEVVCASGRYDLDAFAGYQIGVTGDLLQTYSRGADEHPIIEVERIEVLASR
jgi:hypothetical protein